MNSKDADETEWMYSMICTFVVSIGHGTSFVITWLKCIAECYLFTFSLCNKSPSDVWMIIYFGTGKHIFKKDVQL